MSAGLKTLVQRIASDPQFRARFVGDPKSLLDEAPISAHERGALLRVCQQLSLGIGIGALAMFFEWP